MSTFEDLRALRFAATLADVAPAIRLRIRNGERAVLHVAREEVDDLDAPTCHPDAFRVSIARSHRSFLLGEPAGPLELLVATDPVIDIGLMPGDAALPGGTYRLAAGAQHLHLFMTTLPPSAAQRALSASLGDRVAEEEGPAPACCSWRRVGLHYDQLTEVTVVHAFAEGRDADGAHAAMLQLLEVLVAAEALAELGVRVFEGPALDGLGEARP